MKWNIKVKTEGLTDEENQEIYNFVRKLRRKSKCKNGKRVSYKMTIEEKTYVTR